MAGRPSKLSAFRLWLEPGQVLSRVNETEDHVAEVVGVGSKRVDPVFETDRIRIASQVAEVFHRHKAAIEELVEHYLALDHRPHNLGAGLRAAVQRCQQVSFV